MTQHESPLAVETIRHLGKRSVATIMLVAACCLIAAGCGSSSSDSAGSSAKTFATPTYPFSFNYPGDWKLARDAAFTYGSGSGLRSVSVALKEPNDQVTITQYRLKKTLPAGLNGNQKEVDGIVDHLTQQANGSASQSTVVKYGGIPGYQYTVQYPAPDKTALTNKLTFLFKGKNEFQINCQSSKKNAAALTKGCNQILTSLKFN